MESQWKPVTFQWMLDEGIIKPQKLYESIVIIKWPNHNKFNSAAMGVKFGDEQDAYLSPFTDTDTYDLLKNPNVRFVTINLTDNVLLIAKTALTGLHASSKWEELNHSLLDIYENYAFVLQSQIVILCDISERIEAAPGNRGKFRLKIAKMHRTKVQPQPVNRGDNLALEAIVYASKITGAKNSQEIQDLVERVGKLQYDIRRFSYSPRALKVCDIIDRFLEENTKT